MPPFGPLGRGTVHIAVDMQRLFADPGPWRVPDLMAIAPTVAKLAAARPGRSLFTRFVTPWSVDGANGWWKHYYSHWKEFIASALPPGKIDLIPELAALAEPDAVIDKLTHSAFDAPAFEEALKRRGADTLVVTGVETDVCVLATILAAIDRGYRVVAISDALASSSSEGHATTLAHVLPRFDRQVEIVTSNAALAAWPES